MLMYPEFTPEVRAMIVGYRMAYEPARAKMVAPHVTLVFGVKQITEPALVELCEDVARRHEAFDVLFAGTRFEPDVLDGTFKGYLDIGVGAQEVRELHHALYQGPHASEYHRDIEFVPHMTIATVQSEVEMLVAKRTVGRIPVPVFAPVRALSVERLTGGRLTRLAKISLGKAKAQT